MLRLLILLLILLSGCAARQEQLRPDAPIAPLAFPADPAALENRCRTALNLAAASYDRIAAGGAANPLLAYEEAIALLGEATDPLIPLAKLHPDSAMRKAAADCKEQLANATIATLGRSDLYDRLKTAPVDGADQWRLQKLLLQEFRSNGLEVAAPERAAFQRRAEQLASLENEFTSALVNDNSSATFTQAELSGVPDALIARLPKDTTGLTTVASAGDAATILRTANLEATRQAALRYLDNRGSGNLERLSEIARLRQEQAKAMGKTSWQEVRATPLMAGTPERVNNFLDALQTSLAPLVATDRTAFARLKGEGNPVHPWDISWLSSRLHEESAGLDEESLRRYFPLSTVRDGLFSLASRLLGLQFVRQAALQGWSPTVELYQVQREDGSLAGWLYLDLFYRPGKADSSYEICLRPTRETAKGQLPPVTLLVSNLRQPADGEPHLAPRQLKTLLHEFGHTLQDLLISVPYASLGSALIPWDAIEIPSTLFENLAYEPTVLALLSGNRLPDEVAARLRLSQQTAAASRHASTLLTARFDAALHGPAPVADPLQLWQNLYRELLQLPPPEDSRTPGTFSHLVSGYDGSYYGYLWSAVIAAELREQLQTKGLITRTAGMRLENEFLFFGNSRAPEDLLRIFLGREFSNAAFIESLKH
ncbi:thimet oligopeptidase [Geobacter sp. OR-1]|uniref:M3 family metallopeptidase n=1 Tax=Geobacter sp. OR-1 TaxID=1266765 RepID=UPI000542A2E0|nr:M3 family metallopeptidase [Geobacter sp. OR-1]GAM11194.1 thimet oligopeptidase [Geobacter sp. OR-1]